MEKRNDNYFSAGSIIIDIIMSNSWIIDTLKIMKMYMDGAVYSRTLNTAYITAVFLTKFNYKDDFSDEEIRDILTAVLVQDIGAVISDENNCIEQIKETIDYLNSRINNENVIEMVKYHLEKEDGSGPFEKRGNELSVGTKIIIVSSGVERMISFLNLHSFDKEVIEKEYMTREKFIENMNTKYDNGIVEAWKEWIKALLPEVNEMRLYLNRFSKVDTSNRGSLKMAPIQLVIDSLLDNIWIRDYLFEMKKCSDDFLYIHSLNTGIHTASIILMGNYEAIQKSRMEVHDIVIGSILHDVGYIVRETINHTYHLCVNLSPIEKEVCKWHIIQGKELLEEYFNDNHIHNKDTIINIVEMHHEYEDCSGIYGKAIKNTAIKIVNIANAVDLQIYKTKKTDTKIAFTRDDKNYRLISSKFDAKIINNIIGYLTNALNNVTAIVG